MDEIKSEVLSYLQDWQDFVKGPTFEDLGNLKPMHFGWKVAEESDLIQIVAELTPKSRLVNIARVDNRKLALIVTDLPIAGVPIVEIMQRRPESADKLGLDHLAFWHPSSNFDLVKLLTSSSIKWEHQQNEGHAWISLWFGDKNREAKFFDHTALDIAAKELSNASDIIKN
jgi:hypothetical protein